MKISDTIHKKANPKMYEYFHNMPIKEQIKEFLIISLIFSAPFIIFFYFIYTSTV